MTKFLLTLICAIMMVFMSYTCDAYQQNYDVRKKSNITEVQLNSKLKGNLKGTAKYFLEAQRTYGINAVFLAAVAMHESGNGSSRAARTKNNFFGIMEKKSLKKFSSPRDCIMYTARILTKKNGYYFGSGRFTIKKIGKKYAACPAWSTRVIKHMKQIG